jgi:hypothetical protein
MAADGDLTSARTPRGAASQRIIRALADVFPEVVSRKRFLESDALARNLGKAPGEKLNDSEKAAAAKTLGRLIESEVVGELLFLRQPEAKSGGAGAGLIAISVSLTSLKQAWESWRTNGAPADVLEPNQEWVIREIVKGSKSWVETIQEKSGEDSIPLIFRDISIVHGSESFDILVFLLYNNQDEFLQYVREVIQKIPHIERTHTMQISTSFGVLR